MSSITTFPAPFSGKWKAGHWQAPGYAGKGPLQRLAHLNDMLGKAHDHHMAEKANNQLALDELHTTMNAPPYVCAVWVEEQLAAAAAAAALSEEGKKEKECREEGFSSVTPSSLPEQGASARSSESSNCRFLQYLQLLVSSQKALPPPTLAEVEFLPENHITDTARAITSLAHTNEYPIIHRPDDDAAPVALVNIPKGSTIYREPAWLNLPLPLDPTVILAQYDTLSASDQTLYDSMGHNTNTNFIKKKFPNIEETHPAVVDSSTKEHAIIATWLTHQDPGVHLPNAPGTRNQDNTSIYAHLHKHVRPSCAPNCNLVRDERYGSLVLRSARAIARGELLTYSPIPDYPLLTHAARARKLEDERGISMCDCDLCCQLLPPATSSSPAGADGAVPPDNKNEKGKDATAADSNASSTANPDAIPHTARLIIESRRLQASFHWAAWRILRQPSWSPSSTPTPSPAIDSRPSAQTIEALALQVDELLGGPEGGAVSPVQAWFRCDASYALQEAGDYRGAERWARMDLEADAVLLGLGHEGCWVSRMRVEQVRELV
ncbi:hypothetical protein DBV05_g12590 [Lasiodiplodia theobromae]|uniref:SET domain-containing protein n=1 Tax=Lasiodiplodia theobromae TaxID=45133 RepID=A0A5N5CTT3_9PEZI|nr:hypothetical protein DBV05_g12590 [Lasiodiplodia theobromae]